MRFHHRTSYSFTNQWLAAVCIAASLSGPACYADPAATSGPTTQDQNIAKIVAALLARQHVSQTPVGDETSRRALDTFIRLLDPGKLYFLQSDIDSFQEFAEQIDDRVTDGDVTPAFTIFRKYLTRVDEATEIVRSLLDSNFDFTTNESVVIDPKKRSFAQSSDGQRKLWRKELKLQLLQLEAMQKDEMAASAVDDGEDSIEPKANEDPKQRLLRRYARAAQRLHRLDTDKLLEKYLTSISSAYDPHTTYMSPGTMEQFMIQMRLNLEGIGAKLREDDDFVKIIRIIEGGGASRNESIQPGDLVLAVAQGIDGQWQDAEGLTVDRVASTIRGKAGTTVRLKLRSKTGEEKEASIVRSRVELQGRASGNVVPFDAGNGELLNVGYIALPSFYRDAEALRRGDSAYRSSSRDVRELLEEFSKKSVGAVVLDLRENGGGFLDEAINLTGLFIDQGPVVQVKQSSGKVLVHKDMDAGVQWTGPLAVLTSKYSASASEIVAGAIQDYGRGIVIGDPQTHGKGTVQTAVNLAQALLGHRRNLPNLGSLKVTIQTYYLPDGDSTQVKGVAADVVLPSISTVTAVGESDLDHAMPSDTVKAARHSTYAMLPADLLTQVRTNSAKRVEGSKDFKKTLGCVEKLRTRKQQDSISIQRDRFMLERQQLLGKAEAHESDAPEKIEAVFPVDEYDSEVLEVVHDYVEGLVQRDLASTS